MSPTISTPTTILSRRRQGSNVRQNTKYPMIDRIQELRDDIARHFDRNLREADNYEESISPSGRYKLSFDVYGTSDTTRNWSVAEVQIFDLETAAVLHSYIRGDYHFFHAWVIRDGLEFLLLSEHLEGQSIYCPELNRFDSVAPEQDEFIWCLFHPSPTGRYLAVEGCVWGCPFMVTIYDFAEPLQLPLPKVLECYDACNIEFDTWISDSTFRLKTAFKGQITHSIP